MAGRPNRVTIELSEEDYQFLGKIAESMSKSRPSVVKEIVVETLVNLKVILQEDTSKRALKKAFRVGMTKLTDLMDDAM